MRLTFGRLKAALGMAVDEGKLVRNMARLVKPSEYVAAERAPNLGSSEPTLRQQWAELARG